MLGRSDWLETRKLYIINSYINRIAQRSLESTKEGGIKLKWTGNRLELLK